MNTRLWPINHINNNLAISSLVKKMTLEQLLNYNQDHLKFVITNGSHLLKLGMTLDLLLDKLSNSKEKELKFLITEIKKTESKFEFDSKFESESEVESLVKCGFSLEKILNYNQTEQEFWIEHADEVSDLSKFIPVEKILSLKKETQALLIKHAENIVYLAKFGFSVEKLLISDNILKLSVF